MKYCGNCGTQIDDNDLFCDECGAKQSEETIESSVSNSSTQNQKKPSNKKTALRCILTLISIALLIISVTFLIKSCIPSSVESTPETLEEVATVFTEAFAIKFNAKTAVSLMSEDLISSYIEDYGFPSEKELIERFNYTFSVRKDDTIGYYGDDWKAEVIEVKVLDESDGYAIVQVSVSHTGSDSLWNTNIDDWRIYLKKENDVWRVYAFEG